MADSRLVRIIDALYRRYTPQEIADAHRVIRQQLDLVVEIKQTRKTIEQAQQRLEELENVDD